MSKYHENKVKTKTNNKKIKKSKFCEPTKKTEEENWQDKYINREVMADDEQPFRDTYVDVGTAAKLVKENATNEKQFRGLKPKILVFICVLVAFQLLTMNLAVVVVIIASVVDNNGIWFVQKIDPEIATVLCDFLKYYISATIVELLAMLFFIIRSVYNKSTLEMFRIFHGDKKEKPKHLKQDKINENDQS